MTIRVIVVCDDSRPGAVISVQCQNTDGTPVSGMEKKEIAGGGGTSFYVHSGQQLLVKEERQP